MVWNVEIVIGQSDAVPAHLVNQVFPENDDLLAAVLDPEKVNKKEKMYILKATKPPTVWLPTADLPAWVCGEHRKRHPLSELLCDVIGQWRPEEERFIYVWSKQANTMVRSRLTWAEWCQDPGLQGQEQTESDYCWFKENMLKTTRSENRPTASPGPTCCGCWGGHR